MSFTKEFYIDATDLVTLFRYSTTAAVTTRYNIVFFSFFHFIHPWRSNFVQELFFQKVLIKMAA